MADPTRDEPSEPSLELPSLFRRKRPARPDPIPADETAVQQHEEQGEASSLPEPPPADEPPPAPVAVPAAAGVAVRPRDRVSRTGPVSPTASPATPPVTPAVSLPVAPPVALPLALAAALTGLVVGLVGTALTYGGLEGCEQVRGTSSCGGPGLLLLVGIVAIMALGGAVLLAALGVREPRSTSVLAVGLVCVVAMVALLEVVFSAWMFVAVPLLSAAAYLLASLVTTRVVEQLDDGPNVDVR